MDWLNYHHLFYFWTVVREGGVSKASKVLRLAQPTVSGQIKVLENAFGEKLFQRQGRSLVLTDVGQVVFRYADEIFSLGRELQDALKGRPVARPRRLVVGVSDSLEKRIAHRLLAPALELDEPVHLVVQEARPERREHAAQRRHAHLDMAHERLEEDVEVDRGHDRDKGRDGQRGRDHQKNRFHDRRSLGEG